MSMEDGESKPGQERQEFSFTLYDFDGHGKITKDVSSSGQCTSNKMLVPCLCEISFSAKNRT